jgi:F-type H+-transporting ATPase subunit a
MMWLLNAVQEHAPSAEHAPAEAGSFDAAETIMGHVANNTAHPLIDLPPLRLPWFEIDFSISKHVFMLWLVAAAVFIVTTWTVRRYLKKGQVPSGFANVLETVAEFVRDSIVEPFVGRKWTNTWAPLMLTFFVFIFSANLVGMIPIFDILGVLNHWVLHADADSFFGRLLHGGTTATANFNVTAGLAIVTFGSIIVAGSLAHGFVGHWKNLAPHGLAWWIYLILYPIEIMGMFVKPFALTMRLAANMTGGHIAILAILCLVFIFTEMFKSATAGIAVGLAAVPLAVAISALELIVVVVQAYVFTLLSAVFIGMAVHTHH